MEDRLGQLDRLVTSLRQLISLMEREDNCPWVRDFRGFLEQAESLRRDDFSQSDLNTFSASVMSVYGGMGSFNDFVPDSDGRIAPWVDEFHQLRSKVYERALALRVVGGD